MCLSARLHKFLIKRNDSQFSYNSLALPPPLRSKDSRQEVSEPTPNFDKLIGRSSSFPPLPSLTSLGSHAGHVAVLEPIMMSSEEHGSTSCLPWATWREANPQVVSEQEHRSYPFLSCSKPVSPPQCSFLSLTKGGGCDNLCRRLAMLSRCRMRNSKWWTVSCLGVSL